jgi:hypothetical protein
MRAVVVAILLLVGAAGGALAGTQIETEARGLGSDPPPTRRGVMRLEPDRMRLDVAAASSAIIYRGDLDLIWIVDHRDRSFARIDRATLGEFSRRIVEVRDELRVRLAAVPPEQRAALERMLGKTLAAKLEKAPGVDVRETGRTERVNDVGCAEVEIRRGDETIATACTADWERAGLERETFRPIQEVGALLRQTLAVLPGNPLGQEGLDALDAFGRLGGVPLRIRIFEAGAPTREIRVTSMGQRRFAGETFEVPEGYEQAIAPAGLAPSGP